jgi:hypothetical protein
LENAPYFTAFVASSLKAMPSARAAFGGQRMFSPVITTRFKQPEVFPKALDFGFGCFWLVRFS